MKDCEEQVFNFIKRYLTKTDPTINLEGLKKNTDLASIGVESLTIVSLISEIEEKLKINITLSNLEKYNYEISVVSICGSMNNEES